MNTLDQYIHKATRGLPKKERLDAAAELRSHMIEKIKDLMQQGFSREEATFLTLQEMGDPQVPLVQRFRQFAQYQLPYWVLAALLLGGGGWWAKDHLFAAKVGIYPIEQIGVQEMRTIINLGAQSTSGWKGVKLVLPRETKNLTVKWVRGTSEGVFAGPEKTEFLNFREKPANFRGQYTLLLGSLESEKGTGCSGLTTKLIQFDSGGVASTTMCNPLDASVTKGFSHPWSVDNDVIVPEEFKINTWTAVAEIHMNQPLQCTSKGNCKTDDTTWAEERSKHPERWNVVLVYASDHRAPETPRVRWNAERNRWEAQSLDLKASE